MPLTQENGSRNESLASSTDTYRDDGDGLAFKTKKLKPHCSLLKQLEVHWQKIFADADLYNDFFLISSPRLTFHLVPLVAGIVWLVEVEPVPGAVSDARAC